MKNIKLATLANLALAHDAYIPVFEKYGLDFCCRGKMTLKEVCTQKNISLEHVVNELMETDDTEKSRMPFTEMKAEQLISYIIVNHHYYVKKSISTIYGQIEKIVTEHGNHYPHMPMVLNLFMAVTEELLPHMEKEEKILFPRIIEMSIQNANIIHSSQGSGLLDNPIMLMEKEHDRVGQLLFEIRTLTNQYTPPDDACTTHKICLAALKAFEENLHLHIHLENNILFPMAKKFSNSETNWENN